MKILAIDCSLKVTGIALLSDGKVIASEQKELGREQSAELPLMAERVLNKAWSEINYIALTNGPGYFTGIRVGAAYATGLAFGLGISMIAISSLEMLAHSFTKKIGKDINQSPVLVAVYAGHGFVYASSFGISIEDAALPPGEYSHDQIKSWLNTHDGVSVISDDPARMNISFEKENIDILEVRPDIISLGELAFTSHECAVNPMGLKILYYRAPQGMI